MRFLGVVHMPRIPAIGSVGRKIVEFEASLNFIWRPFL